MFELLLLAIFGAGNREARFCTNVGSAMRKHPAKTEKARFRTSMTGSGQEGVKNQESDKLYNAMLDYAQKRESTSH